MKLKTLKDINFVAGLMENKKVNLFIENFEHKVSRQEAIKWVKQLQEEELEKVEVFMRDTGKKAEEYFMDDSDSSRIIWIKHFFNITEEEIKEGSSQENK